MKLSHKTSISKLKVKPSLKRYSHVNGRKFVFLEGAAGNLVFFYIIYE